MTDVNTTAAAAQESTLAHLKTLLAGSDHESATTTAAIVTGAIYAVVRVAHAIKPKAMTADKWRLGLLASITGAAEQLDPSPDLVAERRGGDVEAEWLQLMGDTACTMTQELARTLHDRGSHGPCCPMSGVVPGIIAGAVYAAVGHRDRDDMPNPADVRPYIDGVVTAALEEAAQGEAREEAAAAMGEARGHG